MASWVHVERWLLCSWEITNRTGGGGFIKSEIVICYRLVLCTRILLEAKCLFECR